MTPSTSSPASSTIEQAEAAAWWPADAGAAPRFATQRDPTWLSDGPLVAAIAEAMGRPLLPWQRHVVDVATEYRVTDDGLREYHYRTIVVSVPRQTGKTTLLHALGVYRAMVLGHDFFYTAQTGKDARARWSDLIKVLRKAPAFRQALKDGRLKVALRGGSEHVEFPNGHVYQAFAPTDDSLHGYTPPTVVLDEAFAHDALKGDLLMGAISPAQQTVRAKQLWIVSTMGTAESTFLHDWMDRAAAHAPGTAGFIWGASDHHDVTSLDDIADYHPGVGYRLNDSVLTAGDVLAELDNNSRAEYERAFANRRTLTLAHLIAPDDWRPLGPQDGEPAPELPDRLAGCHVTYDVSADRLSAGIMATWLVDGIPTSRVLAAAPGIAWLADAVHKLATEQQPAGIGAVGHGPVLEVTADLVTRGVSIDEAPEREYATACGAFLTLIETGRLRHDGTKQLLTSVTGLVPRPGVVDGVAFSRKHSVGDSSLGIAMTLGTWRAQRVHHGEPLIEFSA